MCQRVRIHGKLKPPQAAACIGKRAPDDGGKVFVGELTEDVDPRTGQQRRIDLKRGVLGGRSDQDDGSILHVGQKDVLLGLVEAVDLVDKEDRLLAVVFKVAACLFDDLP